MKWRWKARKYDGAWAVVMRGPVDYEVAAINGRREDPEAIARFIAAAPELLEALRLALPAVAMHTPAGALFWPEGTPKTEDGEVDLPRIASLIGVAIAKATGGGT